MWSAPATSLFRERKRGGRLVLEIFKLQFQLFRRLLLRQDISPRLVILVFFVIAFHIAIVIFAELLDFKCRHLGSVADSQVLLSVLQALVNLLKHLVLDLVCQTEFLSSFADGAGGQIEIDLVNNLTQMPLHVGYDDCLRQPLAICLVPAVVLYLDMQVQ